MACTATLSVARITLVGTLVRMWPTGATALMAGWRDVNPRPLDDPQDVGVAVPPGRGHRRSCAGEGSSCLKCPLVHGVWSRLVPGQRIVSVRRHVHRRPSSLDPVLLSAVVRPSPLGLPSGLPSRVV